MITIVLSHGKSGHIEGFTFSGHADRFIDGDKYDLVCASIGAISLTCALGLRDVLKKKGIFESKKGWLQVDLGQEADEKTDLLISTMLRGLKEIHKQYPNMFELKK